MDIEKPDQGSSKNSSSEPESGQSGVNRTNAELRIRDNWDKLEILLRPVAAFLTAITVALIGWFGQQALDQRSADSFSSIKFTQEAETERARNTQEEITRRTEISQNYRLYTQIMSKREESESALRKDMFSTILKEFFKDETSTRGPINIAKRLLKLELLALNFGETLSLSPLFIELDKDIGTTEYKTGAAKDKDRKRLRSLAKRVSQQQLSALATGGKSWDFEIPFRPLINGEVLHWPEDNSDYQVKLEDVERSYSFRFSTADFEHKSVNVNLEIKTADDIRSIEQNFNLDFFNFPMVNNTRLTNDQRFALIMTKFENKYIHFSAISFPGKYSSQRDKPFMEDVIHRLQSNKK